jgi:hemolysin III
MFGKTLRDPVSSLTHLYSAAVAVLAAGWLFFSIRADTAVRISVLIYAVGLVGLFLASGIYHGYTGNGKTLLMLRKWDHSAIYLLIAGTYTPICLGVLDGFWRWGLLGVIWGMAAIGIGVKLFTIHSSRWLTAGIYLVMGWLSVFAVREMLLRLSWAVIFWLLLGGIFYTVGALVYITKKMDFKPGVFGFHEVWHIFVMLGAFSHFVFIALALMG